MNTHRQTFSAKIEKGQISFYDKTGSAVWLELLDGKEVDITIEKESNKRTLKQNNAIHLYCQMLADELLEAGLDMKQVIKADIPATMELVKENIWRRVQQKLFGKKSTTQLNTDEVSKVYEVITKAIGQEWGIYVEFPHEEDPRYQ